MGESGDIMGGDGEGRGLQRVVMGKKSATIDQGRSGWGGEGMECRFGVDNGCSAMVATCR